MVLAHMSDFHIRPDCIEKYNDKIKQLKKCIIDNNVDVIVYTGDVIDCSYINQFSEEEKEKAIIESYDLALDIFNFLRNETPVKKTIICSGNHDIIRQEKFTYSSCKEIDECSSTYINAYKYFNDFCEKLNGSREQYKTRIEEYKSKNENYTYSFLVANTNWFNKNSNSKSTSDCINCFTVKRLIDEQICEEKISTNIFISHLPIDLICECGKYCYGPDSGDLYRKISKKFSICLAGDKHSVSVAKGSYIVGNPLDKSTTIGLHKITKGSHLYESIEIYDDKYTKVADEEQSEKIFNLCKPFLSNHALNLLFNKNDNVLLTDVKHYFSSVDHSQLKKIEEMYQQIINFKQVDNNPKESPKNFTFNYIAKKIEQNNHTHKNIINFKGEHESGKSTFLSILYMYLMYQYMYNSYKYIPIYFNIGHYRKMGLDSRKILREFKNFIKETKKIYEYLEKPPCFIIDGLNQYCLFGDNPDLGNGFNDELKLLADNDESVIIILSIDTFDNPLDAAKSVFDSDAGAWKDSKQLIYFNTIKTIPQNEQNLRHILECIIEIKNSDNDINDIIEKIYEESILSMHLMFLFEYYHEFSKVNSHNILHNINSDRLNTLALNKPIESIATKTSVGLFFNKKTFKTLNRELNSKKKLTINAYTIMFEYIKSHKFFSNYLIAGFYVTEIKKIADGLITKKADVNKIVNAVLPQPISYFIRQEFEAKGDKKIITDCLDKKSKFFDEIGIANLVYLSGNRIGIKNTTTLKKLKESIADKSEPNPIKHFKNLILYRSITISQILSAKEDEYKEFLNEYLNDLISDSKKRDINRVFHLMYYQDTYNLMEITEVYGDNGNSPNFDFYYTYNTLIIRLNSSLKENRRGRELIEIDLFTLCDLISCRIKNNKTNDGNPTYFYEKSNEKSIKTILKTAIKFIDLYLLSDSVGHNNSQFISFLKNAKRDFELFPRFLKKNSEQPYFHPSLIINQLDLIKKKERQGWLIQAEYATRSMSQEEFIKQRKFPSVESVAEHIYMTYLIGLFYLPSYVDNNPEYNKQTILNIILIHDIGESYTGDSSPYMKTFDKAQEDEDAFNRSLFSSWMYIDNTDFSDQMNSWDLWKIKTNNGNINNQIANDLDKVQLLYQLSKIDDIQFRFTEKRINSFKEIRNKIETPIAKHILKLIVDENVGQTIKDFIDSIEN